MSVLANELWWRYWILFITDISLYHAHIITIGALTSTLILLFMIAFGIFEVHRPLQRLKVFTPTG